MSYILCVGNEIIRIVEGSLVPIAGKGKISSCAGLSLYNILHVLRISYDLLSISKITHKLNCKSVYLSNFVSFHDLS